MIRVDEKQQALITVFNLNNAIIKEMKIGYTDFPLSELKLYFVKKNLYLASEFN